MLALARRIDQDAAQHRAQRADGDVLADRPEREDAVGLAVAGDQRDRLVDRGVAALRCAPRRRARSSISRLAMAGEPGKADDLAVDSAVSSRPSVCAGRARARTGVRRRSRFERARRARAAASLATLPIAATSESRVKSRGRALGDTLPSRITTMRSAVDEDFAEEMRDQDAARRRPRRSGGRRRGAGRRHARRATRSARRG